MMDVDDRPRGLLAWLDSDSGGAPTIRDWMDQQTVAWRTAGDVAMNPPLVEPVRQIVLAEASPNSGGASLSQIPTEDLLRQLLAYLPDSPGLSPAQSGSDAASGEGLDSAPARTPFRYLERVQSERHEPSTIEQYLAGSLRWLGVEPRRWLTGQDYRRPERPAVVTGPRG